MQEIKSMNHEIERLKAQVEAFQSKANIFERMMNEVKDMRKLNKELSNEVEELKKSKKEFSIAIQELKQRLNKENGNDIQLLGKLLDKKENESEIEEEEYVMDHWSIVSEDEIHNFEENIVETNVKSEETTSFYENIQKRNSSSML